MAGFREGPHPSVTVAARPVHAPPALPVSAKVPTRLLSSHAMSDVTSVAIWVSQTQPGSIIPKASPGIESHAQYRAADLSKQITSCQSWPSADRKVHRHLQSPASGGSGPWLGV